MPDQYSLVSVHICDDIRYELNNKKSMMGIYDSIMATDTFPYWMSTFGVRVAVNISKKNFDAVDVYILNPSQEESARLTAPFNFTTTKLMAALYFRFTGFLLTGPGDYSIYFGMDHPSELVYKFSVLTTQELAALME